jgi:hypothetical protein
MYKNRVYIGFDGTHGRHSKPGIFALIPEIAGLIPGSTHGGRGGLGGWGPGF